MFTVIFTATTKNNVKSQARKADTLKLNSNDS